MSANAKAAVSDARTTLYLRGVQRHVVREAKAEAARRGTTLAKLINDTLARRLSPGDEDSKAVESLDNDMRWYLANRERLIRRFRGEFVAVIDRAIDDHDADFEALAQRVFARHGVRPIYMPFVRGGEEPIVRVRSPRRVAG